MNGATAHTTDRHPGLALARVAWWMLAQPAVIASLAVVVIVSAAGAPAGAALSVGLIVGLGVAAATFYARHHSVTARLRRAMVEVGLVHREGGRPPVEPRRRGRSTRDGRNLLLRWEMPPGVTSRRIADHLEELERRVGVGLTCWFHNGRLHTEVLRHRLPDQVDFGEFYSRPRAPGSLVVGLGRSRRGSLWCDLAQLPHLLVGGMSGGGKSVFLRQLLTWLVLANQPSRLRLLVLDFKAGVELVRFGNLPHALHPAVTDTADAELALRQVVAEIDRRMTAMAGAQVVDLDAWDASGRAPMPRWVIVCDELARLTIGNAGESKEERGVRERGTALLCDIARMGRAAGVHLVVCTQRPDADAVPGQLKACLAGTVAFRVRNEANSRILLDCDRAALLPPVKGRALWQDHCLEEFQAIHLGSDECFRLIEDRWLREVDHLEEPGGIRRWSPTPTPNRPPRWQTLLDSAMDMVRVARVALVRAGRVGVAAVRARGAGVSPAADQGDGCVVHLPSAFKHSRSRDTAPPVTPSAIPTGDRDEQADACGDSDFGPSIVSFPPRSAGGPRVAQGRQNTEERSSLPEEPA